MRGRAKRSDAQGRSTAGWSEVLRAKRLCMLSEDHGTSTLSARSRHAPFKPLPADLGTLPRGSTPWQLRKQLERYLDCRECQVSTPALQYLLRSLAAAVLSPPPLRTQLPKPRSPCIQSRQDGSHGDHLEHRGQLAGAHTAGAFPTHLAATASVSFLGGRGRQGSCLSGSPRRGRAGSCPLCRTLQQGGQEGQGRTLLLWPHAAGQPGPGESHAPRIPPSQTSTPGAAPCVMQRHCLLVGAPLEGPPLPTASPAATPAPPRAAPCGAARSCSRSASSTCPSWAPSSCCTSCCGSPRSPFSVSSRRRLVGAGRAAVLAACNLSHARRAA